MLAKTKFISTQPPKGIKKGVLKKLGYLLHNPQMGVFPPFAKPKKWKTENCFFPIPPGVTPQIKFPRSYQKPRGNRRGRFLEFMRPTPPHSQIPKPQGCKFLKGHWGFLNFVRKRGAKKGFLGKTTGGKFFTGDTYKEAPRRRCRRTKRGEFSKPFSLINSRPPGWDEKEWVRDYGKETHKKESPKAFTTGGLRARRFCRRGKKIEKIF